MPLKKNIRQLEENIILQKQDLATCQSIFQNKLKAYIPMVKLLNGFFMGFTLGSLYHGRGSLKALPFKTQVRKVLPTVLRISDVGWIRRFLP